MWGNFGGLADIAGNLKGALESFENDLDQVGRNLTPSSNAMTLLNIYPLRRPSALSQVLKLLSQKAIAVMLKKYQAQLNSSRMGMNKRGLKPKRPHLLRRRCGLLRS